MCSFPQRLHKSVLPMGRAVPFFLRLRSDSRYRSLRQLGQYQARGPPEKTLPHWRQARNLTGALLKYRSEQSWQR